MIKKILLVEDDLFLRQLYSDLLSAEKYDLDTAEEGDTAFEKMKKGGYDLVLLDMMLPGQTGLQIMEKLKTDKPSQPNKKVVFLTNTDNEKETAEMKKISDGYILKSSVTPDQFLEKVKGLL